MDWVVLGKLLLKSLAYSFFTLIFISCLLVFIYGYGIPFVEGDTNIKTGNGFHFKIGMNKSEVFDVIKDKYNKDEYFLRVLWKKSSVESPSLEAYVNKKSNYLNSPYNEWKAPVKDITELIMPLKLIPNWKIKMPAAWKNYIYLTFQNDRLVEIRQSKWVFERA